MNQQKVILVTGASSGLGLAMANALVAEGHLVYGTSRDTSSLATAAFNGVQMDVTDDNSVRKAIQHIISIAGRIDTLINNAGITITGSLCCMPASAAQKQFDVNVLGIVRTCSAVLPSMVANNRGLIINIGSLAGLFGLPYQGLYSASKFAVEGYTQSLRMELKNTGIKVTVINPGDYKTNITRNREKVAFTLSNTVMQKEFETAVSIMEEDEMQGADPQLLAHQICKIINKSFPAVRYLSGSALQRITPFLQYFLPARIFELMIAGHYGIK